MAAKMGASKSLRITPDEPKLSKVNYPETIEFSHSLLSGPFSSTIFECWHSCKLLPQISEPEAHVSARPLVDQSGSFGHSCHFPSGTLIVLTMAKKGGENSKKAAGNARKAENANKKKQAAMEAAEAEEAAQWEDGAKKGNKKKEEERLKKEEAARKKAERDALLAAEESVLPTKGQKDKQRGAAKVAARRTGKIDDFLDFNSDKPDLSASGIDNALEALSLTGKDGGVAAKDIERHPERRVKAAYAAYEERRLPEIKKENPGLRQQQMKQIIFKEFQKSPENPMNQASNVLYNATVDDVAAKKKELRSQKEKKFT